MNKEARFEQITHKMLEIYKMKNADYGSSVSDTYRDFGLVSFLVRLQDKLNRLKTLNTQDAKIKDEKIEDTLLDLANYAILARIELDCDAEKRREETINKLTELRDNLAKELKE